jgi:hypothetical protein
MKEVRRKKNAQEAKLEKSIARKYGLLKRYCDDGLALQQSENPEAKWTSLSDNDTVQAARQEGHAVHSQNAWCPKNAMGGNPTLPRPYPTTTP